MDLPSKREPLWSLLGLLFQAHPWHGVPIGDQAPEVVTVYVELTPADTVKYELDKHTGHLKIDRPQRFSNVCPMLYGLVPQTYCAESVAELCMTRTGRTNVKGDGDPLDICILAERTIIHGNILMQARPIGGLRLLDGNEADDKILAVMKDDAVYGSWRDLADCPQPLVERLQHYFLTYKDPPLATTRRCELAHAYGADEARDVIRRAMNDYRHHFSHIEDLLTTALRG
jgi:inorganic pyrophosphatase